MVCCTTRYLRGSRLPSGSDDSRARYAGAVTPHSTLSRRAVTVGALLFTGAALSGCSLLNSFTGAPPEGEVDAFAIEIGDCLNDATINTEVTSVPFVECSEPHDSEVFARTDTSGTVFPGNTTLETELDTFCQGDVFTAFVGIPYADSIYNTSGYFPSTSSWQNGDRELLCTVFDPNGPVTGTLQGING